MGKKRSGEHGENMEEDSWEFKEGSNPIGVMKDRPTGDLFTNVFPKKGRDEYAIRRVGQDLFFWGHKKIIIKSDQEPAIKELKPAIKREREEDIMSVINQVISKTTAM